MTLIVFKNINLRTFFYLYMNKNQYLSACFLSNLKRSVKSLHYFKVDSLYLLTKIVKLFSIC